MSRPRSIIAMKGPPFTRKTEFATLIAKSLKCPVLSLDDVMDVLHPDSFPIPSSSTCAALHPQDMAFQILCKIAKSHLQKEVSDNVVIDSPLSSQSHLNQLIKLATSLTVLSPQSGLVIVECKPKSIYSWKLKFENYLEDHSHYYTRKWYKAKNWDDVGMAMQSNFDETAGGYDVSKLVLDPLVDIPIFLGIGPSEHRSFMEAIQYMTTREKGDGPIIVLYSQWRQSQYLHSLALSKEEGNGGQSSIMMDRQKQIKRFCKGSHCITGYSEEGPEHEANCLACEKQVKGAAYTCMDCSLVLHKDCAESFDNHSMRVRPSEFAVSLMYACTACKEDGQRASRSCTTCLFETNVKRRMMPTVIRHDCEKHFLSLVISRVQVEAYLCAACGHSNKTDFYSCKICNLAYHIECLTEAPRRLEHVHGGHHHHMLLKFSTEIQEEDYICHECLERRVPQLWSYSCEICQYEAHLYCVLHEEDNKPPSVFQTLVSRPLRGRRVTALLLTKKKTLVSRIGRIRRRVHSNPR